MSLTVCVFKGSSYSSQTLDSLVPFRIPVFSSSSLFVEACFRAHMVNVPSVLQNIVWILLLLGEFSRTVKLTESRSLPCHCGFSVHALPVIDRRVWKALRTTVYFSLQVYRLLHVFRCDNAMLSAEGCHVLLTHPPPTENYWAAPQGNSVEICSLTSVQRSRLPADQCWHGAHLFLSFYF